MNKKKLVKIGKKVDISKNEIDQYRKRRWLLIIITPIIGVLGVLASYCMGRLIEWNRNYVYPYQGNCLLSGSIFGLFSGGSIISITVLMFKSKKDKKSYKFLLGLLIATLILSIITLITGIVTGQSNYSEPAPSPMYGVYSRER